MRGCSEVPGYHQSSADGRKSGRQGCSDVLRRLFLERLAARRLRLRAEEVEADEEVEDEHADENGPPLPVVHLQ